MIKGNKVYLTRDLHTSNNGSPVVSGAVLSEKPLLYCLINFSQARKQVKKISLNKNLKNNALHIVSCVAVVSQFS